MNKVAEVVLPQGMSIKLNQADLDDIMCAALEGGISYWCGRVEVVDDYLASYAHQQISRGGTLKLYDVEDDEVYELNFDKLVRGLELFLIHENDTLIKLKQEKLLAANIDSICADLIVQYALFGELVFS